jgi:hypothetical protein
MLLAEDGQKRQPAEIDGDSVIVGHEVEVSEVQPAEKPVRHGGSKSMKVRGGLLSRSAAEF